MADSDRRLAVVTGANKGIGFFVAKQLVQAGLRVVIACRNAELGAKAAAELGAECLTLDISSEPSIQAFVQQFQETHGRLDVLVNNAAIAFKDADPTPFAEQTEPTLRTNFFGTMSLTDKLLPLLRASSAAGRQPRIVNVASMAGRLSQVREDLQSQLSAPTLTRSELVGSVQKFSVDVKAGRHRAEGWGNSNYGMSKLALISYTKILAREEGSSMRVNACCPGYCATDMSSHRGTRSAEVGARNASMLALLPDDGPSGAFFQNEQESVW